MTVAPATIPLKSDERAILQVLADAAEPLDSFGIFSAIMPPPQIRDARRREHKQWRQRQFELTEAEIALWKAGFLIDAIEADGEHATRYAITGAGRVALAETADEREEV